MMRLSEEGETLLHQATFVLQTETAVTCSSHGNGTFRLARDGEGKAGYLEKNGGGCCLAVDFYIDPRPSPTCGSSVASSSCNNVRRCHSLNGRD